MRKLRRRLPLGLVEAAISAFVGDSAVVAVVAEAAFGRLLVLAIVVVVGPIVGAALLGGQVGRVVAAAVRLLNEVISATTMQSAEANQDEDEKQGHEGHVKADDEDAVVQEERFDGFFVGAEVRVRWLCRRWRTRWTRRTRFRPRRRRLLEFKVFALLLRPRSRRRGSGRFRVIKVKVLLNLLIVFLIVTGAAKFVIVVVIEFEDG